MIYEKVRAFYKGYKKDKRIIGYSYLGREIFAFRIGGNGDNFISVYAVHGREWITAELALYHIKAGVSCGGWIIPLANPDGAVISQTKYPMWKANARGVDLNCNFDAEWGTGISNTRVRSAENCIGCEPFSESESKALRDFTIIINPKVTLSWHTKGGEIYWEFSGAGDKRGAEILACATGYKPKLIYGSAGGYKDWCIEKFKIPAYTIECGNDNLQHPIGRLKDIKECKLALRAFTYEYFKHSN